MHVQTGEPWFGAFRDIGMIELIERNTQRFTQTVPVIVEADQPVQVGCPIVRFRPGQFRVFAGDLGETVMPMMEPAVEIAIV